MSRSVVGMAMMGPGGGHGIPGYLLDAMAQKRNRNLITQIR